MAKAKAERAVKYPELKHKFFLGDHALTAKMAEEALGWQTEEDYISTEMSKLTDEKARARAKFQYGEDYLLKDENNQKVRCLNNDLNRPFKEQWARALAQDILNRRWADSRNAAVAGVEGLTINGESIIIGRTGRILSAQHRLIALVLAKQMWEGSQKVHWLSQWETEPTMECSIVYGVDESIITTRTLDNTMPRGLADCLATDPDFYGKLKQKDIPVLSRIGEFCVRTLWSRTPCYAGRRKNDAFAPRLTNSEAMEFIERHPHIKKAVKHIFEEYGARPKEEEGEDEKGENGRKKKRPRPDRTGTPAPIGMNKKIPPGTASALLYLMGSANSDVDTYTAMDTLSERKLDWDLWTRACEFWSKLCKAHPDMLQVFYALGALYNPDGTEVENAREWRVGTIIKAWLVFKDGHKINADDLELGYTADEFGLKELYEYPSCGGIDLGSRDAKKPEEEAPHGSRPDGDPTEEEIRERAEQERARKEQVDEEKEPSEEEPEEEEPAPPAPRHPRPRRKASEPETSVVNGAPDATESTESAVPAEETSAP